MTTTDQREAAILGIGDLRGGLSARPGSIVIVPAGMPHKFTNTGTTPAANGLHPRRLYRWSHRDETSVGPSAALARRHGTLPRTSRLTGADTYLEVALMGIGRPVPVPRPAAVRRLTSR